MTAIPDFHTPGMTKQPKTAKPDLAEESDLLIARKLQASKAMLKIIEKLSPRQHNHFAIHVEINNTNNAVNPS
jgi:hypothetical protein